MELLQVKNLTVAKGDKRILESINISVNKGEIHALLGPNGQGKTTLLLSLIGQPECLIEQGDIIYQGEKINDWEVNVRSNKGIFYSFQNPPEISGVNNVDFIKAMLSVNKTVDVYQLYQQLNRSLEQIPISGYLQRNINEGFSGGEKKKNELLQLLLLKPQLALIDEIDSGLDVDAIKVVATIIKQLKSTAGIIIISHNLSLLKEIGVSHVHVLNKGKLTSGPSSLLDYIARAGFSGDFNE